MSTQPSPLVSQRRHWYANDGAVPDQVPGSAESVSPWRAVPATVGAVTLDGGSAATTAVASEVALVLPAALEAVTDTRTVPPTSAARSAYVAPVSPAMSW